MTTRFRPVNPRAVRRAPMTASVPEFANRTLSILGQSPFIRLTTSISIGVEKPEIVPKCVIACMTA